MGKTYRRQNCEEVVFLGITQLSQPLILLRTVKSTVYCAIQYTIQCTVQCTLYFLVHHRHVGCPGTIWVVTFLPVKTKLAFVFPKYA